MPLLAVEADLLSTVDAADILGLPEAQIGLLAGDGRLATAALSVGGTRLFRRADVEELAAELAGRQFHHHAVQFYESAEFLHGVIARFVARGLHAGSGAVLLLTEANTPGVRRRLAEEGFDVPAELDAGRLLFLDAHETLDGIMHRGLVDAARFFALVGGLIDRMGATPARRLRAYGEMVDLLCAEGLPDAALQVEQLWEQVTRTQPVSLLCAYDLEHFRVGVDSGPFDRICAAHTRVVPTERFNQGDVIDQRYRAIAQLQQRARALQSELPRRTHAEQLVREREQELRDQNEQLSRALRAKDEFLAMLGHELRNPLAPILLAVDLLRQRHGDDDEFAVIDRQIKHLVRLVDDLLDVARLVRGKVVLQKRRVSVADLVERGIELSPALAGARRADLALELPSDLQLEVDVERMAQVLSNVLTNAAKYSDPGSPIAIRAELHGAAVRLSVRDRGIGIEPELLERVFELFVQQEQALDRSEGGLGLGLAIVRKLVELHGGEVSARSAGDGQGTELLLVLPALAHEPAATPAEAPAAQGDRAREQAAHPGRRILLVDDNEDAAALLARVLENLGHDVSIAHDGPGALEQADRCAFELALLDLGLPGIDGFEVASRLRALQPALRLIAISGYGDPASRERSTAAGFEAHLLKPIRTQDLAALLR